MTTNLFAIERNQSQWDLSDAHWPSAGERHHVFIRRFDLPEQPVSLPERLRLLAGVRLYLFGCRVPDIDSNGFRVNYTAVEIPGTTSSPAYHDLHQAYSRDGDGVFFSTDDEHARYPARKETIQPGVPLGEDFLFRADLGAAARKQFNVFVHNDAYTSRLRDAWIQAGRPKNTKKWLGERIRSDFHHFGRMPRWTEDEGDWPFVDAEPMPFVAQTMLSENATTREHLSFDEMLYLFVGLRDGQTVCKLYQQSVGIQTAEAHYRLEELLALYHAKPHDPDVIHKVVTEGDRFVHQYLLDQPTLPAAALALLAQHAANKDLRTKATQRLRSAASPPR